MRVGDELLRLNTGHYKDTSGGLAAGTALLGMRLLADGIDEVLLELKVTQTMLVELSKQVQESK